MTTELCEGFASGDREQAIERKQTWREKLWETPLLQCEI